MRIFNRAAKRIFTGGGESDEGRKNANSQLVTVPLDWNKYYTADSRRQKYSNQHISEYILEHLLNELNLSGELPNKEIRFSGNQRLFINIYVYQHEHKCTLLD